jgi:putative chitinase
MPENIRSVNTPSFSSGPYLAKIVSHVDPAYMGTLQVQLLRDVGSTPNSTANIFQVKYLTPFYGVTGLEHNANDATYNGTQKSYGMWMIPPDPGTIVMVIFVEGDPTQGYWMGCVQDSFMNHMVPGIAASEYHYPTQLADDNGKKIPVAEYNKRNIDPSRVDPSKFDKPAHPMYDVLLRQGLIRDDIRGITSSSARREVPSMVFGISTPGPLDNRSNARTGTIGKRESAVEGAPVSRLGGTTLVMDDGDPNLLRKGNPSETKPEYADQQVGEDGGVVTIPANELVRIRTRTGHQILLHNSEDLIYIANARGTAWIELTSNGKVDIFAADSVSIHTKNDLNFTAARDINLIAGRDINTNAMRDTLMTSANNMDVKIGVDGKITTGSNFDMLHGAGLSMTATTNINVLAGDTILSTAGNSHEINSGSNNNISAGGNNNLGSSGDYIVSAAIIHMNGPAAQAAAPAGSAQAARPARFAQRLPQFEPWQGHENFDPTLHTPDKTIATTSPPADLREFSPPLVEPGEVLVSNGDSGPAAATSNYYTDPATGRRVESPQVVVPGDAGQRTGAAPANPVPVNDMQRYFLHNLIEAGITDPVQQGVCMAQPQAECGFVPKSENLNYRAETLRRVFPSRVRTQEFAEQLVAGGPAAIGNTLYGNRYGNAQDEGYKYRGRGLIQITFKDNYRRYGGLAGVDIVNNPDLANDPEVAVKVAIAYLKSKNVNLADIWAVGRAVGYAQYETETPRRASLATGFTEQIRSGRLTPLSSLTTTQPTTVTTSTTRAQ